MNFLNYLFLTLFSSALAAQSDSIPVYPKADFIPPLDIPLMLAGSFGEPRPSHFHMGMDIRTNEKEGLHVYAVGDGYVSRVGVSPNGYGNVLYITHPNGYTTVYGHLSRFNDVISAYVRREQYAKEDFSVDITFKPNEITVRRGEIVAYSGNTGASGGPHLHFEIRDAMERAINPLDFGFRVDDHVAPVIGGIKLYPMDETRYSAEGFRAPVTALGGKYTLKNGVQKVNATAVGIAVNTFDHMDEKLHTFCPYNVKLYQDDALIFEYKVDRVGFDFTRCILAQVDYPIFLREGSRSYQKCFLERNNALPSFYYHVRNYGIIALPDTEVHHIKVVVTDHAGNSTQLDAKLQYSEDANTFKTKKLNYNTILSPSRDNVIADDDFKMKIPAQTLMDSMYVSYSDTLTGQKGVYSKVIKIDQAYDQLLGYADISIKPIGLPDELRDKAMIVWKDWRGNIAPRGSKWEGNMLTGKCREFGTFFIMVDTTAPRVTPVNILKGKNMRALKNITVRMGDNLSGIASYKAYIDGKWELMSFDGKTATARMVLPDTLTAGEHIFKMIVTDDRNNQTEYSVNFNY